MPPMGGDPMADGIPPMSNQQDPMMSGAGPIPPQGNPMAGGDAEMPQDGNSEFDTGFDAGVEADEDEDPKKFIQQLTGKLSQSLNKYNNENGEDEELSKYVGKMITAAAAKGLDEKGRKELIKSINTADSNEDGEIPDDEDNVGDKQMDNSSEEQGGEEKGDLESLYEELNQYLNNVNDERDNKSNQKRKHGNGNNPFSGKNW